MIRMYGIKNCDTIKKARKWLEDAGVEYQFHDYKKDGLNPELLDGWISELGYETLLNKRGTTWRKLPDAVKDALDESSARTLMLDNPAIIKRPLLDTGSRTVLGFSIAEYADLNLSLTNAQQRPI